MANGVLVEPTEAQRQTVRALSGYGVPQSGIAIHLGIDAKTLRKHFGNELDRGSVEATTKVARSLFTMATKGNNVAAAIFWMKARAGWREKQLIELRARPLEEMSDEDLEFLIARIGEDEAIEGKVVEDYRALPGSRQREPPFRRAPKKLAALVTRDVQHRPTTVDRW